MAAPLSGSQRDPQPTLHSADASRCKSLHFWMIFYYFILTLQYLLLPSFFWAFCTYWRVFVAAFFGPATTATFKVSITTGAAGGRTSVWHLCIIVERRNNRDKYYYTWKAAWKTLFWEKIFLKYKIINFSSLPDLWQFDYLHSKWQWLTLVEIYKQDPAGGLYSGVFSQIYLISTLLRV